jgi:transposase-like protein
METRVEDSRRFRRLTRLEVTTAILAFGVAADGRREVLGFDVGDSENEGFWTAFLRSLKTRGLDGVKLVISDAHTGLKKAISAAWQRCRVHYADVRIMPMSPVVPFFRAGFVELMSA